jgi:excisionase family DNA binding protein
MLIDRTKRCVRTDWPIQEKAQGTMPYGNGDTETQVRNEAAIAPYFVSQLTQDNSTAHDPVRAQEVQRFFERRRSQALGYELPLNTREAAAYVGLHPKTVERMARQGLIPAHPVSGVRRKTWRFFPSELDAWLHGKIDSPRRPCPPNGKESVN